MKQHIIKFRVTKLEQAIIKKKAKDSGIAVSELLRRLALGYKLTSKLSPEEIEVYKTLANFSSNFTRISNLFKLGDVEGFKKETLENIHEIDFSEQIAIALQNKNYRLVVRLLYLQTLKQLSDKNLIDWQPEKTNQTYVSELKQQPYHQQFVSLTNQFEYIWYGEFYIDENTFQPIYQSFQEFNTQMA